MSCIFSLDLYLSDIIFKFARTLSKLYIVNRLPIEIAVSERNLPLSKAFKLKCLTRRPIWHSEVVCSRQNLTSSSKYDLTTRGQFLFVDSHVFNS